MEYKLQTALIISKVVGMDKDEVLSFLEIPPQRDMGDYAFPCFFLAKSQRKAPAVIAAEMAEAISSEIPLENGTQASWLEKIEASGPYVNFYLNRSSFIKDVICTILETPEQFLKNHSGEGKTIILEYSSPNIAKPFHIGHALTTTLGHSLSLIYEALGYHVVRMNHLGDYGTQFGKLIVAYRLWGDRDALEKEPIEELLRIYVKFHQKEKENPALTVEARDAFRLLEEGSEKEKELWTLFRDLSLKEFARLYERMGISFDNYNGESFYSDRIPGVVNMLEEKGLLVESEGAKVVMLDEYGIPPCIILKSDGTTIYASRDIASVLYRYETYHFDKNVYVVGSPQSLHFRQVFAVLEKAGFSFSKDCIHVGFGLVKFTDMKFSTRDGNIITLEELLDEAVAKTQEIIKENAAARGTGMCEEEIQDISEKVGLGSVIYTFLKSGRDRDIIFSWEEMLDFEGDTAPYLIYTYARIRSLLRKAGTSDAMIASDVSSSLSSDDVFEVTQHLYAMPEALQKAAESYEPFMLARQISALARSFNRFYNNSPILSDTDESRKKAHLALCRAVSFVLKYSMELLGIPVVERM